MVKIIRSVVFMLVLSAICTAVPAWLKESTEERVRGHELLKTRRNVLTAMKILPDGATPDMINDIFRKSVLVQERNGRTFWATTPSVDTELIAFAIGGPGFWGPIEGVVAVNPETYGIVGVTFTKHSETPGLGGRIDESWFKDQFTDLLLDPMTEEPMVRLMAPGNRSRPTDVDAITGATETSKKIQHLFDNDVRAALLLLKDEPS